MRETDIVDNRKYLTVSEEKRLHLHIISYGKNNIIIVYLHVFRVVGIT